MIKVRKQRISRVSQGDIFRDIEMVEWIDQDARDVVISRVVFPLVMVLTQDCDLEQDYRVRWSQQDTPSQDKMLLSVLVCPLYNAEHVYAGTHLEDLGQSMQPINRNRGPGPRLRDNQDVRYHYLEFPDDVPIPASVIDFKHYFSVNVRELKKKKRTHFITKVAELYREDISQRFAAYLSRVGLPTLKRRGGEEVQGEVSAGVGEVPDSTHSPHRPL